MLQSLYDKINGISKTIELFYFCVSTKEFWYDPHIENKNVLSFTEPREGEATFAPKMTEKVKSLAAPDGSQVEFVCKVEGSPRPQITWFRQTAIIKPSQDFQVT